MDAVVSVPSIQEEMKTPRETFLSGNINKYTKKGNEELTHGKMKAAVEAFDKAYSQAIELNDDYTLRGCAFNLGAIYIATGQPQRGIELLEKAIPPENTKDGTSTADLYYNFGLAHDALHHHNQAIQSYERAALEYKDSKNIAMEAETHSKLASVYKYLHKYRQAGNEFGLASELYESGSDMYKQTVALCEQGSCLLQMKDIISSTKVLDDCLQLCGQQEQSYKLGKVYHELGLGYVQLATFSKAVQCFELALPLFRDPHHSNRKREAVSLMNLGAVYNSLADFQRAIRFHEDAAALHNELGDRSGQGQCFSNLAFAFSQLADYESAGEAYLHALQAAKDTGNKRAQWQASEGLAAVYYHQGDIEKAITQYKQALSLVAQCADTDGSTQDRLVAKLTDAIQYHLQLGSNRLYKQRRVISVKKSPITTDYLTNQNTRGTMTSPQMRVPRIVETQPSVIEISRPVSRGRSKRRRKRYGSRHHSSDDENFKTIALGMEDYSTDSDLSLVRSRSGSSVQMEHKPPRKRREDRKRQKQSEQKEDAVRKESEMIDDEMTSTSVQVSHKPLVADYKHTSSSDSSLTSVSSEDDDDDDDDDDESTGSRKQTSTVGQYSTKTVTYETNTKEQIAQDKDAKEHPPYARVNKKKKEKQEHVQLASSSSDENCYTSSESESDSEFSNSDDRQETTLYETLGGHQQRIMESSIPMRDPPPPPPPTSTSTTQQPPLPSRSTSSPTQSFELPETSFSQMTRADREKALYELHGKQSESQTSTDTTKKGKTKSKMCVIM
ncbi:uncharacterized protein LOC144443458 isoform X1 [Glandiceps talaboti]